MFNKIKISVAAAMILGSASAVLAAGGQTGINRTSQLRSTQAHQFGDAQDAYAQVRRPIARRGVFNPGPYGAPYAAPYGVPYGYWNQEQHFLDRSTSNVDTE